MTIIIIIRKWSKKISLKIIFIYLIWITSCQTLKKHALTSEPYNIIIIFKSKKINHNLKNMRCNKM